MKDKEIIRLQAKVEKMQAAENMLKEKLEKPKAAKKAAPKAEKKAAPKADK
jgi:alpha-amylase